MDTKVIDKGGSWHINVCQFDFTDPDTKVIYIPGVPTKAKCEEGSWLALQKLHGVIKDCNEDGKVDDKKAEKLLEDEAAEVKAAETKAAGQMLGEAAKTAAKK